MSRLTLIRGKLARRNLTRTRRRDGYSCWGLRPGSPANAVANIAWIVLVAGGVVAAIAVLA